MPTSASSASAAAAAGGLIVADLDNQKTGAGPVFYATTDASYGELLLTITNASTGVVQLGAGSKLLIYFAGILDDDQIGKITVNTAGWSGGPANDGLGVYIALTATAAQALRPGDVIPILLNDALASGAADTGYVTIKYSGFPPCPDGEARITAYVQAPPSGGSPWPIDIAWGARSLPYAGDDNTVYVTAWTISTATPGVANELVLTVSGSQNADFPWPSDTSPSLMAAFATGDDNLAICSDEQLKDVGATITSNNPQSKGWQASPKTVGPTRTFSFTPNPGNKNILAAGEVLTVTFSNLVTTLPANFSSSVSIQLGGLAPDYDDGYELKTLDKTPPTPALPSLTVTVGDVTATPGAEILMDDGVTMTWDAFGAEYCYISGDPNPRPPSGTYAFTPAGPFPESVTCSVQGYVGSAGGPTAALSFAVAPPPSATLSGSSALWPIVNQVECEVDWSASNAQSCAITMLRGNCFFYGGGPTIVVKPRGQPYQVSTGMNGPYSVSLRGSIDDVYPTFASATVNLVGAFSSTFERTIELPQNMGTGPPPLGPTLGAERSLGVPVAFELNNQKTGDGPIFYATNDDGYGQLLLTVSNASTNVLNLAAGAKLLIYLVGLLSDDEIGKITVSTAGWSGGPVNDGLGAYIALTSVAAQSLKPGDTIAILLNQALASGPTATGYVRIKYSGFSPLADSEGRITAYVQTPATDGGSSWPIDAPWAARSLPYVGADDTVYVTTWTVSDSTPGVGNEVALKIVNTQTQDFPWPSGASPVLIVAFPTGDDNLAICSDDELKDVVASISTNNAQSNGWQAVPSTVGPTRVFTITPNAGNPNVLAAGEVLSVTFSGLVTTLPASFSASVSLQYGGLADDGYDDGYLLRTLDKTPPTPVVVSVSVTSAGQPVVAGSTIKWGEITLAWDVFAAEGCYVDGAQQGVSGSSTFGPAGPFPQAVTCQVQPFIGAALSQPWSTNFTVLAPPPPTVSASGWIEWGDYQFMGGQITWSTTGATECTVVTSTGDTIGTSVSGTWYPPQIGSPFSSVTVSASGPGGKASNSFPIQQRG